MSIEKKIIIILSILVLFQYFQIILDLLMPMTKKDPYPKAENPADSYKKPKLILFANPWYRYPHYPYISEASKLCPACKFTENMNLFETSSAVVFHGVTLNSRPPVSRRHQNQIWVWLIVEPPRHSYYPALKRSTKYLDMFNWTMTYRHDSDIYMPYGLFVSNAERSMPSFDQSWAFIPSESGRGYYNKTSLGIPNVQELINRKMAAWIVSHCRTGSARENIAKELGKHISLDIYGDCGKKKCAVPRWNTSKSGFTGMDCRFEISSKYKFYLSFESSPCEDYVTEKYFDTLYTQMVPIVYGSANYSQIAPRYSFINVADFKDVKSLAYYLKYLNNNPKEYIKYFKWRKHFWVQNNGFVRAYCMLCDKLWNLETTKNSKPKIYHNVFDWFLKRSDFNQSGQNACDWIQEDKY